MRWRGGGWRSRVLAWVYTFRYLIHVIKRARNLSHCGATFCDTIQRGIALVKLLFHRTYR